MANLRHLVVMHGWTEDDILKVVDSAVGNCILERDAFTVSQRLDMAHDVEHAGPDGYFDTEELPAEERDKRQARKPAPVDHSH